MQLTRRAFLKQLALAGSLLGAGALSGCLGDFIATPFSRSSASRGSGGSASSTAPPATIGASSSAPAASAQNASPVWQRDPTIEFVEGVPSKISVKQFVQDADNDTLIGSMQSGSLPPGITWTPNTGMIGYDRRPLGAKADAPLVVSGPVFAADDGKP